MSAKAYTYRLTGTVKNPDGLHLPGACAFNAVILPSDTKSYLAFGFRAAAENRVYNGVFYVRLEGAQGANLAATLVKASVNNRAVTVIWNTDIRWDPKDDPSYVIDDAELA